MGNISDGTRQSIILAAVASAGPVGGDEAEWNARVQDQVVNIAVMLSDTSPVSQALENFAATGKPFPATIIGGRVEKTSTRLIVKLRNKDGEVESIRTDRTDTPTGLAMGNKVRSLVDHRVLVWKQIEMFGSGSTQQKVRILRHVVDLGLDPALAAGDAPGQAA